MERDKRILILHSVTFVLMLGDSIHRLFSPDLPIEAIHICPCPEG